MHFDTTSDGKDVEKITILAGDLSVGILTFGATLHEVRLKGVEYNLTRGADNLAAYAGDWRYHGGIIGPIANRIGNARINVGGMMHELERNQDGRVHLHSGKDATHAQVWRVLARDSASVTLALTLPDGMCGLPGHREITATYSVSAPARLTLEIGGTTDGDTVMNFTQHGYWNLDGSTDWTGHHLRVDARCYLPTDDDGVPTGEIVNVEGTLDLQEGPVIASATHAFDHNYCLAGGAQTLRDVAWLTGASGVQMILATTEAGLQVYDGQSSGFQALALEAQGWPDAPNHRGFPSIKLRAGQSYAQTTSWTFCVSDGLSGG
ncbi:aldose epimerase family protein [Yoonia sp. MH D7]